MKFHTYYSIICVFAIFIKFEARVLLSIELKESLRVSEIITHDAMASATPVDKQHQLAAGIAKTILESIKPEMEAMKHANGELTGMLLVRMNELEAKVNDILTRLSVLSSAQGTSAVKKPVRTTAERKVSEVATPSAPVKRTTASAGDESLPEASKIKNAMLYARMMWATSEEFRDRFSEYDDIISSKITPNPKAGPVAQLLARGSEAWRSFPENVKKTIKEEFANWKTEMQRTTIGGETPLDAEVEEHDE